MVKPDSVTEEFTVYLVLCKSICQTDILDVDVLPQEPQSCWSQYGAIQVADDMENQK